MRLLALYRDAYTGLPREVWILSLVLFINRCGSMVLGFLVLYLTTERGYTMPTAGNILAVYGFGALIGIGLGGYLVDRIGYRRVQIGSMYLAGAGFVGFSFLESSSAILGGALFLGAAAESFRPANGTAVAAFTPPALRSRAYALNRLALNLGYTVGPALGGLLAEFSYAWLFWIDGATCALAGLSLAVLLPASSAEREFREPRANTPKSRSPWRDGVFLLAFVFLLLQCLVFFQLQSTYSHYLVEGRGYSKLVFGLVLAFNATIVVLCEMPLIRSLEGRHPLRLMAVASVLVGLGFGLLPLSGSLIWISMLALLWTLGEMLASPTMSSWVATRAAPENRGAYMAAFGIAFSLGFAGGPWIGTRIYEYYGPEPLWWSCLGVGTFAGAGFLLLARYSAR